LGGGMPAAVILILIDGVGHVDDACHRFSIA
jgi:hypothetical protein